MLPVSGGSGLKVRPKNLTPVRNLTPERQQTVLKDITNAAAAPVSVAEKPEPADAPATDLAVELCAADTKEDGVREEQHVVKVALDETIAADASATNTPPPLPWLLLAANCLCPLAPIGR